MKINETKNEDIFTIAAKPEIDASFSSWATTVAHSHYLKLNSLIAILYGGHALCKKDIDKHADLAIVTTLSARTNTPVEDAIRTSVYLRVLPISTIDKNVYSAEWVTHVSNIYTTKNNYGMTFCPLCLSNDQNPYYRRDWRLSFVTMCKRHKCLLLDRCPNCGMAISLYRMAPGSNSLAQCWSCGFELSKANPIRSECFDDYLKIQHLLLDLLDKAHSASGEERDYIRQYFMVFYHFSHLIMNMYYSPTGGRMAKHGNAEYHTYLDSYSPINRLIILELAFRYFSKGFKCNYFQHLKLHAAGKIRNFHRRKQSPCHNWCSEHDYLHISKICNKTLEEILNTKITTPI